MSILEFTFKNEHAADIVYTYLHSSRMSLLYSKDKTKVLLDTTNSTKKSLEYVLDNIKQSKIPIQIKERER